MERVSGYYVVQVKEIHSWMECTEEGFMICYYDRMSNSFSFSGVGEDVAYYEGSSRFLQISKDPLNLEIVIN